MKHLPRECDITTGYERLSARRENGVPLLVGEG